MKMSKLFIPIITLIILSDANYSQTIQQNGTNQKITKNSVYGSLGLLFEGNINYERQLFDGKEEILDGASLSIRMGYGESMNWYYDVMNNSPFVSEFLFSGNLIKFSKKNHHQELDIGIVFYRDSFYKNWRSTPLIKLGYRFKKPEGHIIIRCGLGWPALTYFSFGFAL